MGLTELPGELTEAGSVSEGVALSASEQLLSDILKELKIMNIHLYSITGEKIHYTEIE